MCIRDRTVIDKTLLYLENYREMERYIKEAVSETSQVPDIGKYNISAERAFLQSVRECRAETVILFEHLKQALASLKEDAEAAGEGYKYDALEAVYIKGKTYEDIMTNPTVFGINGNSLMVGGEAGDEAILPLAEFYNKLNNILDKKLDAVQKSNIVYVTNHTYIDGDEVASRTVSRVDAQMVTDKRKGR